MSQTVDQKRRYVDHPLLPASPALPDRDAPVPGIATPAKTSATVSKPSHLFLVCRQNSIYSCPFFDVTASQQRATLPHAPTLRKYSLVPPVPVHPLPVHVPYPSIPPSLYPSVRPSVCRLFASPSLPSSLPPSIPPSIHPSICASAEAYLCTCTNTCTFTPALQSFRPCVNLPPRAQFTTWIEKRGLEHREAD